MIKKILYYLGFYDYPKKVFRIEVFFKKGREVYIVEAKNKIDAIEKSKKLFVSEAKIFII